MLYVTEEMRKKVGTSIYKQSAKRLGKFVYYIEHLDSTNCTTMIAVMLSVCLFVLFLFLFFCFAVNMHLSACLLTSPFLSLLIVFSK